MDWPTISIAGAALGVLVFMLGYRFGATAGYMKGAEYGYKIAEKAFLDAIDQHVKLSEKVLPLTPIDLNLTNEEIEYLTASVAALDKKIETCDNEESKKNFVNQREGIQSVIDQDKKEKANV